MDYVFQFLKSEKLMQNIFQMFSFKLLDCFLSQIFMVNFKAIAYMTSL